MKNKILNTELPYDPASPFLSIYPQEMKIYDQTKYSTQMFITALFLRAIKVETTAMSISWGMDKYNIAYLFNGIWLSHEKEERADFTDGKIKV